MVRSMAAPRRGDWGDEDRLKSILSIPPIGIVLNVEILVGTGPPVFLVQTRSQDLTQGAKFGPLPDFPKGPNRPWDVAILF